MKNYSIETQIRAKLLTNEKLSMDERKIVEMILNANDKDSLILKKQYPDLHFFLTLKKIETENT